MPISADHVAGQIEEDGCSFRQTALTETLAREGNQHDGAIVAVNAQRDHSIGGSVAERDKFCDAAIAHFRCHRGALACAAARKRIEYRITTNLRWRRLTAKRTREYELRNHYEFEVHANR